MGRVKARVSYRPGKPQNTCQGPFVEGARVHGHRDSQCKNCRRLTPRPGPKPAPAAAGLAGLAALSSGSGLQDSPELSKLRHIPHENKAVGAGRYEAFPIRKRGHREDSSLMDTR